MKSKTKTTKNKSAGASATKKPAARKKDRQYPAYYLAAVLAGILLLEGFLLGAATPQAWSEAMQVLDVSASVQVVTADLAYVFEPMLDQVGYVEEFYQLAATELMYLFDASDVDHTAFFRGVNQFYYLASVEMETLLDFSDSIALVKNAPQVAGAAIFR